MFRRTEDARSAEAAQQPHGQPEDLSNRFNVPSAMRSKAAASVGRGSGPDHVDAGRQEAAAAVPSNANPPARSESTDMDSTAQEQGAKEAAATLERLRAQNRRHQANHRARVKVWCSRLSCKPISARVRLCPKMNARTL